MLQLFQRGTGADDVVERVARGGIAAEGEILAAEGDLGERAGDGEFDFIDESGTFADVIGRAPGFDGLHGGFVVVDRGH